MTKAWWEERRVGKRWLEGKAGTKLWGLAGHVKHFGLFE